MKRFWLAVQVMALMVDGVLISRAHTVSGKVFTLALTVAVAYGLISNALSILKDGRK